MAGLLAVELDRLFILATLGFACLVIVDFVRGTLSANLSMELSIQNTFIIVWVRIQKRKHGNRKSWKQHFITEIEER
jgi:hypothetical protein